MFPTRRRKRRREERPQRGIRVWEEPGRLLRRPWQRFGDGLPKLVHRHARMTGGIPHRRYRRRPERVLERAAAPPRSRETCCGRSCCRVSALGSDCVPGALQPGLTTDVLAGYSTEPLLNFLAGVIGGRTCRCKLGCRKMRCSEVNDKVTVSARLILFARRGFKTCDLCGSTTPPQRLLTDSQPNNCNFIGGAPNKPAPNKSAPNKSAPNQPAHNKPAPTGNHLPLWQRCTTKCFGHRKTLLSALPNTLHLLYKIHLTRSATRLHLRAGRKLLQFNKICAGLQALETAITAKLSGSCTTADQVTQV